MQTSYTTNEAMGSVSVCVNISSAVLARNVSVTLRSVTFGTAVGTFTHMKTCYVYQQYAEIYYIPRDI